MKSKIHNLAVTLALLALSLLNSELSTAYAQGTAFTYQGRLDDTGQCADGYYNFQFSLWNGATGGTLEANQTAGNAVLTQDVLVTNGLFTVMLDFGPGVFNGASYYLQTAVTTNTSSSYTTLSPRLQILPTPYAIFAETAGSLSPGGTVPVSDLTGQVANSQLANDFVTVNTGTGLNGGGPVTLGNSITLGNTGVLSLTGNSDITVSSSTGAITLGDTATSANTANTIVKRDGTGSFSAQNITANSFTGNGAGLNNVNATTLDGYGYCNLPCYWNLTGNAGTLPGTDFVGTTDNNPLYLDVNSTPVLRLQPDLTGHSSGNLIGGYTGNSIQAGSYGDIIAGGGYAGAANLIGSNSPLGFIGGGALNTIASNTPYGVIAGGYDNTIQMNAQYSFIGGGIFNLISPSVYGSSIIGGVSNSILNSANYGFLGGGYGNSISFTYGSSLVGGQNNSITTSANDSFLGGGYANFISSNASYAFIGGGYRNFISTNAQYAFIGGGANNNVSGNNSSVGGGGNNSVSSLYGLVAGGLNNSVQYNSSYSAIDGGSSNSIQAGSLDSVIPGGSGNLVLGAGSYAVIGGGADNEIGTATTGCTIGGGVENTNSGQYATIPGGLANFAGGTTSFAAGNYATALNNGAFVWSDNSGATTRSFTNNQFMARASGGVVFLTSTAISPTSYSTGTAGVALSPNATAWSTISDRNVKKNFRPVDTASILNKLAAIPIQQWNYKWEKDSDVPNIGPMAQDFKGAFYPGRNDKGITTLEFDGIELAAIQGLNQKLQEQAKEKDAAINDLRARLERLEKMVSEK